MGGNQSVTVNDTLDILQQNITNIITKSTTTSDAVESASNEINISFCKSFVGTGNCSFNVTQSIKADQNVLQLSNFQSTDDIKKVMSQALQQTIESNQKAVNDFLSTAFNNQETKEDINNQLQSILETNITNEMLTQLSEMMKGINKGKIVFCGTFPCGSNGIVINQTVVFNQATKQIAAMTAAALEQDSQIAKAVTDISNSQSSENKGVSDLLKSLSLFLLLPILIILGIIMVPNLLHGKDKGKSTIVMPKL